MNREEERRTDESTFFLYFEFCLPVKLLNYHYFTSKRAIIEKLVAMGIFVE